MSKFYLIIFFLLINFSKTSDTIYFKEIKFETDFTDHLVSSYDGLVFYGEIKYKDEVEFIVESPVNFTEISYYISPKKYNSIDEINLDNFLKVEHDIRCSEKACEFNFKAEQNENKTCIELYIYLKPIIPIEDADIVVMSKIYNFDQIFSAIFILSIFFLFIAVWCCCGGIRMCQGKNCFEAFFCCLVCFPNLKPLRDEESGNNQLFNSYEKK